MSWRKLDVDNKMTFKIVDKKAKQQTSIQANT